MNIRLPRSNFEQKQEAFSSSVPLITSHGGIVRSSAAARTMWSPVLLLLGLFGSPGLSQYDDEPEDVCGDDPCVPFNSCSHATINFRRGIVPVSCWIEDEEERGVCCPPRELMGDQDEDDVDVTTKRPKTTVSELMCEKYARDYPCIRPSSQALITGGNDAEQDEFPHMVEIGFGRPDKYNYACGGSLISEKWVLSAAHCSFQNGRRKTARAVRMGDVQPSNHNDGVDPVVVKIVSEIIHPEYKPQLLYNDIALYKLANAIQFAQTKHIRPICLNTQETFDSSEATAIGFGHTYFGSQQHAERLQKVSLSRYSGRACNESFPATQQLPKRISDATMLCAGDQERRNKDTCNGDSGSSLLIRHNEEKCMNLIIGVTSFGTTICGEGEPGVYTRVSHYIKWIEEHVWPEEKAEWEQTHPRNI